MTTTQSYLFSKNGLQYVSPEDSRSAEELFFAFRKAKVRFQFAIQERNRTHQVCYLKEPVVCRTDILCEFPFVAECCVHGFANEVCYCGLSAVVIYFESTVVGCKVFYRTKKIICASFDVCDDLPFRRRESLVYAYAAILKFGSSGKRHHCGKDAASKFPVHVRIAIFAANQRTGMETVIDKAKNFLRVSVTPVFRPSSLGIIPNLFSGSQLAKYGHCYYEAA